MNIEQEFKEIYQSYAPKVFRLCLGYASGNENLAKEWQQDTFVKVWQHRKSFQEKASISTWIYRIAVNVCLSDLRQFKKQSLVSEGVLHDQCNQEDNESQEESIRKMYRCIDRLTPNNKTIIIMELEDEPQATIAETMGLAHGTLRTRLNRIRQSLLKCITNEK